MLIATLAGKEIIIIVIYLQYENLPSFVLFQIPISALKSVNELLNSKNHGGTETRKTLKRRRASSLN